MKKTALAFFPLFSMILIGIGPVAVSAAPKKTVRIGAFNIQIFSESKIKKPQVLTVLAKIAATYDILAIEEVGSNASKASNTACAAIVAAYVQRINTLIGVNQYAFCRGNQYAIIYRKNEFTLGGTSLYTGSQAFTYTPLTAYFRTKTGNFDFAMLVIHTSPAKAKTEIPALKTAMHEVSLAYHDPDVICLGDYNADGVYYAKGAGTDLAGFPATAYITAISNYADTTVAGSSNAYDRIELSESMATDYDRHAGVFRFGRTLDFTKCEGSKKRRGTENAVSDHYPVWAEFYVDQDTD